MRQLKIAHRLVLMAIAFVATAVVLVYMLVSEQSVAISHAHAERRGVEWHKPARMLVEDLMLHRTYSSAYLAGDASFREPMETRQVEINDGFLALEAVDAKLGAELQTTPLLASLKREWGMLQAAIPSLSPEETIRRHNQVVYDALRLIIRMSTHSNLILDPDIATYFLMDATQFKLAYQADQISQLQAHGLVATVRAAQGQPMSEATLTEMSQVDSRMRQYLRESLDNLEFSLDADADLEAALGGLITVTESSIDSVLTLASKEIMVDVGAMPSANTARWMAETTNAFDTNFKLLDSCLSNLERLLDTRISTLRWSQARALGFVVLVSAVVLAAVVAIISSINRPLRSLGEAAERISLGELDLRIDTSGADEVTDLARKFQRMQESMKIAAQVGGDQLL
jgi:methyl-accepting chemotaxis protein